MIKGSIHKKGITILNVYKLSSRTLNYLEQKLIEQRREIDKFTIAVETSRLPSVLAGHVETNE